MNEKKNRVYVMFKSKDRIIENDLDALIEYVLRVYRIDDYYRILLNTKRNEIRNTLILCYDLYIENKNDILYYVAQSVDYTNRNNSNLMLQTCREIALEYNNSL